MTLPANIRLNVKANFPARVVGASFIAVTKANGIWTIAPQYNLLGAPITPPSLSVKAVVIYDTGTGVYNLMVLSQIVNLLQRPQRALVSAGSLPVTTADSILNISAAADLNISVPLASSRAGAPYTFKVRAGAHSQTINATAPDTFDGVSSIVLAATQSLTLLPANDGVNTGYEII